MKPTIVIPTIRREQMDTWLEQWKPLQNHVRLIIVEDNPEKTLNPSWGEHYCWKDIDGDLGDDSWIVPRRSAGIRVYGFLKALEQETEFIWNLDDDCLPDGDPVEILEKHRENLKETQMFKWFFVDRNYNRTRGMPYESITDNVTPVVSHGTWTHNPDYDALHQLANKFEFEPDDAIVPVGTYFAFSGMNYAFKPSVTNLVYHAPYGERIDGTKYPYSRFDDIWMGVIFKKIADRFGLYIRSGYPQVKHDRASDPFRNLQQEAFAMPSNEQFWKYIDAIDISGANSVDGALLVISQHMIDHPMNGESYWSEYGKALTVWINLVKERRNT